MCGRYVIVSSVETIEKRFQVTADPVTVSFPPNYNVAPGAVVPVITNTEPGKLQLFTFGLCPSWAKKRMYLFNARAEGDGNPENDPAYSGGKGIIQKPSFRKPIRSQRCLVIADAFIEGTTGRGLDEPYVVYLKSGRPFALAGIWDTWLNPETGELVNSFAIITVPPNSLLQRLPHHRSPVVLRRSDEYRWLRSEHLHEITQLLEPYPSEDMNAYPVSPRLKNPKLNSRDLLEPVGERIVPETDVVVKNRLGLQGMKD